MRRKAAAAATRFADVSVWRNGRLVPVDAATYVHLPAHLAKFDPSQWVPRCRVVGPTCPQPGALWGAWTFARAGWTEKNLTSDESAADAMHVGQLRGKQSRHGHLDLV